MISNPMSPEVRRALARGAVYNVAAFGLAAVLGFWSAGAVVLTAALMLGVCLLWPSNPALVAAEEQLRLDVGGDHD